MLPRRFRLPVQMVRGRRATTAQSSAFLVKQFPLDTSAGTSRFGVVVSSSVARTSPARHRLKRLIFAHLAEQRRGLPTGDFVVIALPGAGKLDAAGVRGELARAFAPFAVKHPGHQPPATRHQPPATSR